MSTDRFSRGQQALSRIHGHVGEGVMQALQDIAPDFARMIIEFPYGDVYSRPGLTPKERQIATLASLVTQGNAPKELKAHIQGGLNVGCTRQEITELIMQMAIYAGFPAAVNAMLVAKELFAELDDKADAIKP
ncbi:carboxymuconolactone decarboxylase family protein [Aquabacterium sp.]|uniref:carboxymuconolactone decarboxylase family protein n=1 Tax=Aquabacterium sp. TaxID=1872578 RepID=UPI002E347F51|nr:carboxymuconolactone decarboxylase family protein [Aquabacterium sp.]HEX5312947.1 carboxymuconolactone decarboxylase family protein [Aquabacterium sp.]